jgi:hypothetical protein
MLKKKIWASFQRSEIRDQEKTYSGSRIPDRGVKKAPDTGSGSATLVFLIVYIMCAVCITSTTDSYVIRPFEGYGFICFFVGGGGGQDFFDPKIV